MRLRLPRRRPRVRTLRRGLGRLGRALLRPAQGTRQGMERLWWSSLPLRVIGTILAGSVLVLLLGGLLLQRSAANGILDGKRQSSVAEASGALDRMQTQLDADDVDSSSVYERLAELADQAGNQPDQFRVVIQGPVSRFVSPGLSEASVPDSLVSSVEQSSGMFVVPTTARFTDGTRDEPALAIGATLEAPQGLERYPVFFIFPETHEQQTLSVLRRAVASTGAVLLLFLAGIAALSARGVTGQVRRASIAASRIASGRLDVRMPVRGTDDLARLATSMNDMARELSEKIGELEQLSAVQQRFVSDVSHELRTPLTTVRMAADMLYDGRDELEPFAARSTELMHDELDRFESLLADLLEISRLDAGAAVLEVEPADLVELVRTEVAAERALAEKMGCEVLVRAAGPVLAEFDHRRITRIVRNLLTNALEHGERKPVEVSVAGSKDCVAVLVADHGVGFQAEQAEQVFRRFWRADPSRTRTVGGTGLGLAISLEDAHLHHGQLQAWGRPGQGAQFLLLLPRNQRTALGTPPLRLPGGDR